MPALNPVEEEAMARAGMTGALALGGPTNFAEANPVQPEAQPQPVLMASAAEPAPVQPTAQPAPVQPATQPSAYQPGNSLVKPGAAMMPGAQQPTAGAQPGAQPAAQKYDPRMALEGHLKKLFPDLSSDDLDFASNYMRAKFQVQAFKKMGKENRAHATEYMVSLRDYDRALRNAERDAEELQGMKRAYGAEVKKYGGKAPEGLLDPLKDPELQKRFAKTKADVIAADGRRKAAWEQLQGHYKKTTGQELKDDHELSPFAIRMLMMGNEPDADPTEDLADEHYRGRQ